MKQIYKVNDLVDTPIGPGIIVKKYLNLYKVKSIVSPYITKVFSDENLKSFYKERIANHVAHSE